MFKLQRLEITGFKSFADHTEIVFTGSGITAVVGPNGCGKSNVSDAISWVLGEQRAKSLRGAEMKDVVFQGSKNRKPGGMAEVVLHMVRDDSLFQSDESELVDIDEALSNIDENAVDMDEIEALDAEPEVVAEGTELDANGFREGEEQEEVVKAAQVGSVQTVQTKIKTKRHWRPRSFALDFAPGEAVSVTRRLYLSGESEYELNGRTCRLRDIQDLFAGTGLSGSHYAIIEQGRIGQILSAKPGDRRSLIEEAAGISKFRTRQRAAEARLESAKTNLGRISDIVSEVETQANSLRRQASKTRRYTAMREEFRVLIRQLFSAEGKHLSALVGDLDAKLLESAVVETEITSKVAEKEDIFREATYKARQAEETLGALRQKHSNSALERDRADREHRYQNEQVASLNSRSAVLKGEIEAYTERIELARSEKQRLQTDEQKEREDAGKAETALQEAEWKYQTKLKDVNAIESGLEAERALLLQHTAAVERFDEIGRQLESNIERLKERAEGLKREGVRADEAFAEHTAEAGRIAEIIAQESEKLNGYQVEKQQLLAVAAEARETLRRSEEELRKIRDEFARKRNRLETLQELEEKRAVYAPQVQKLFAEQSRIGVQFAGTLADRMSVDEHAERAVENLFGNFLQSVIVGSDEEARKVSKWLAENEVGRIAILVAPQPGAKAVAKKGSSNIANFLGISDEIASLLSEVFPREMSATLVESFDGMTAKDGDFLVDKNGDFLIGGRLFVSGKVNTSGKNTSLLAFKRELRELEIVSAALEKQIATAQAGTEKNKQALAEKEEKTVDLQSLIIKVERGLLGFEMQEKSIRQEIDRAERHQKVVADETAQIGAELAEVERRKTEAKENSGKADLARIGASSALEKISKELSSARALAETDNADLNEKRTLAATSNERRRSALAALRRVESEEKDIESRLAQQDRELSETEDRIKQLGASIVEISGRISSSGDEQEREREELATATTELKDQREYSDSMSAELAELNRRSAEARNERALLEIRQTEAVTLLRNINEKCQQELNVPLVELIESESLEVELDLEEVRERTEDLREKLENFGAINMLALEELGETEERLLFLTSQRKDIIDGIASTEEALREIKTRSREKFREAFDAININFIEFFQELFGGGRGEMTLLESDDILEAGIEVVAQPPGKRLQNILLLSGGEKAMTAISLVMAIFKYRPSPFCLLDEVDAPLDDANVGRFVNKIAEMSDNTQFIVITHNKRTMEAAKALYGVTMQDAGVSKVVSVKFE